MCHGVQCVAFLRLSLEETDIYKLRKTQGPIACEIDE